MQAHTLARRFSTILLAGACLPLLVILLLPGFALIQRVSVDEFVKNLNDPATLSAIRLSAWTSALSTLIVIVAGTPLAYLFARRSGRVIRILETVVDMPTVFPPAVAGVALLLAFGRNGLIGGWLEAHDLAIVFTPAAVVVAQIFVAGPFYIRTAAVGLATIPREILEASAMDGADWVTQLRHITLPLAWRAILSGAALCWARAVGEFGATMIFAGNMSGRTQTMTLAVYMGFESDLYQALTLAVILLGLALGTLLATRLLLSGKD